MNDCTLDHLKALSPQYHEKIPYLKMLVLFGSRARGDNHPKSDWDFAVLYDETQRPHRNYLEIYQVIANLFAIPNDKIDIVDLDRCSHLIAFYIAKEGILLYEREQGKFTHFKMKAWKLYADTAKFREWEQKNIDVWLAKWSP